MEVIIDELRALAAQNGVSEGIESAHFADFMDSADELRHMRKEFHFPPGTTRASKLYLCGNSLGLQPKSTSLLIFV
jgi:kynureninase